MTFDNHQTEQRGPSTCPFLGMLDDPQTSFSFPSEWNNCHNSKPVAPVSLTHQDNYCLTEKHGTCPVYLQDSPGSLPHTLRNQQQGALPKNKWTWKTILGLALPVLLLGSGIVFLPKVNWAFPSQSVPVELSATETISIPITPSPTPMQDTPTPAPTLSQTPALPQVSATIPSAELAPPSPTLSDPVNNIATPIITRRPNQIESLIGINYLFKIHRVQQDENLSLMAFQYNTTVAAISEINYNFSTPIWVNQVLIIPVNQQDVSDLPSFEAYRVLEDADLNILAEQLGVDAEQMWYYNGLGLDNQVTAGEWLVVPRSESKTQ